MSPDDALKETKEPVVEDKMGKLPKLYEILEMNGLKYKVTFLNPKRGKFCAKMIPESRKDRK